MKENNSFKKDFLETIKENIIFFPIRHHSPVCSYHLKNIINEFKPDIILIEGPNDSNNLIEYMVDNDTKAPFCIYSSYIDKNNRKYRCYYPFLDYSPEFVAIKEAYKNNIKCNFIDMNYASIIENDNSEKNKKELISIYDEDNHKFNISTYTMELTKKSKLRTFDEFWERNFEINGMLKTSEDFMKSIYALGYYMRLIEDEDFETRNREYVMAKHINDNLNKYNKVLVVTGSFHIKGIIDKLKENKKNNLLDNKYKKLRKYIISNSNNYLIPYSFEEADRRKGYKAGIEFPAFYDLIYKNIENYKNNNLLNIYLDVVKSFIIKTASIDRHNYNVSMADCINAYYMAINLSKLRGKKSTGVYELIDAVKSSFIKGEISIENTGNIDLMLKLLSGITNGHISSKSILPPVVIDFRNKCREYKIKLNKTNEVETILDIVKDKNHFEKSKFFHKIKFLNIGFCVLERGPDYVNKVNKNLAREIWKYKYQTLVEASLIDKSVYGVTIEELVSNIIIEHLNNKIDSEEVSKIIIEANTMGLYSFFNDNYSKIENIILNDNNFISLCSCLNNLSYLANMESINENLANGRESLFDNYDIISIIKKLAKQVFILAAINIDSMKNLDEENALKNSHYIKNLYTFTLENPTWCDIDIFNDKIDLILNNTFGSSHIYAVCLAIKYKSCRLTIDDFSKIIYDFLLSSSSDIIAYFLNGIFLVAHDILFINDSIINSIDNIIKKLDEDKFIEILPNFRYAFTNLSPSEIEYLSKIISNKYKVKNYNLEMSDISLEEMRVACSIDEEVFNLIINNM